MAHIEQNRGLPVPAPEKIPQCDPHKYLIVLALTR
jgi:hypothetical protein